MRTGRVGLGLIAILGFVGLACARLELAPRYLSRCPAEGPEPTADLGIRPIPIDLDAYYMQLADYSDTFEIVELARVRDTTTEGVEATEYPILAVRTPRRGASKHMLIVAGVHGNETAGLLAIPRILDLLAERRAEHADWAVTILTPANPVGAVHRSRYNEQGCDINRDFDEPRTVATRTIQELIASDPPDLIVSLHEGAQDGFMLVVTSKGSEKLGQAVVSAVAAANVPLSSSHFLGFSLSTPGLSKEGRMMDALKWISRHYTLGLYASQRGIGVYTTESDWTQSAVEQRVLPQLIAVQTLLEYSDAQSDESPSSVGP